MPNLSTNISHVIGGIYFGGMIHTSCSQEPLNCILVILCHHLNLSQTNFTLISDLRGTGKSLRAVYDQQMFKIKFM